MQKKINSSIVKIEKTGNLSEDVKASLQVARTTEEIEFIVSDVSLKYKISLKLDNFFS